MIGQETRLKPQESSAGTEDNGEAYFNKAGFSSKVDVLLRDLRQSSMDTKR
jgi:hypothetical protein